MLIDPAKIRERRERLQLTKEEAADRAGMPHAYWVQLETGGPNDYRLSTVERVAAGLRCEVPMLLARK